MTEQKLVRKNIIILLKSFALGGAEKQALYLANYLQNTNDCKVYIYAHVPHIESEVFYQECEKYGLKNLYKVVNPLSASGRFKYLKRRIKIFRFGLKLRKHKPDVIIPYLNPPSIIANLCYKVAGAKHTFWHHRGPDYYRNDSLEKKAVDRCPLFVANSPDGKQELIDTLKISASKAHFIPNYITLKEDSLPKEKKLKELEKLKDDQVVLGMVAHFREQKYQDVVLKAFVEILPSYPKVHLILAGNVYESDEELSSIHKVKEIIQQEGIEDKVTLLHEKSGSEIYPYLDIGLLVSRKEGMPNVVMEYMAYGLPVIATNHKGCIALLGEKYEYFVTDQVEEVADKMKLLLFNKEEQKKIGARNQANLFQNFSIENYIKTLETLL